MKNPLLYVFFMNFMFVATAQTNSENLFYMTDSPESFQSFKTNADQISIVCPQTFVVSKEGVVSGSVDKRVLEIAKANDIEVMPLIVNSGFDQELLTAIVSNPSSRKKSIEMMLEYARELDLDGWQFDLEGLHVDDRDNYTLYFQETAEAFHKNGLKLSAAVVHNYENVGGPSGYQANLHVNWRAGYALKELSEIGDFISMMTYDQHTHRTTPGPIAGKEWVERVVKYLLDEGISPNKISLGIPTYSGHWLTTNSPNGGISTKRSLGSDGVDHLIGKFEPEILWNERAGVNYAVWENGGVWEYLFIENGRSLEQKLSILKKNKLRGISVWVLGKEGEDFWDVLQDNVKRTTATK